MSYPKRPDHAKILELRRRGWTYKKIRDELGCSSTAIDNAIRSEFAPKKRRPAVEINEAFYEKLEKFLLEGWSITIVGSKLGLAYGRWERLRETDVRVMDIIHRCWAGQKRHIHRRDLDGRSQASHSC